MRRFLFLITILFPSLVAAQVQDPPQWSFGTSFAAGGLVRGDDGNFYRCLKTNSGHNPIVDGHTLWELYYVRTNTVLTVGTSGDRFQSLVSAWAMVQSATVAVPATVVIKIDTKHGAFGETFTNTFSLDATSGSQISIQGDNGNLITLTFAGVNEAFSIDGGHSFGGLSGFNLKANGGFGVLAEGHSQIQSVAVSISGVSVGVGAGSHSTINCFGSSISAAEEGVVCSTGAEIDCSFCSVTGTDSSNSFGVYCHDHGTIYAEQSLCSHFFEGYRAETEGYIEAGETHATNCGEDGFIALTGGSIQAFFSTASTNVGHGYAVTTGGKIIATNVTTSGNSAGDFNITPNKIDNFGSFIQN